MMPDDDQTPAADRVTALTLRIGDLREQRDQARRYRSAWLSAKRRAVNNDWRAVEAWEATDDVIRERDEARAQVVAATTDADDLRGRIDRLERLFADDPDTPCRTTWPDGIECVEVPMDDLRAAFEGAQRPETGPQAPESPQTSASDTPDLLGPQIGAETILADVSRPLADLIRARDDYRAAVEAVVSTWCAMSLLHAGQCCGDGCPDDAAIVVLDADLIEHAMCQPCATVHALFHGLLGAKPLAWDEVWKP